MPDATLLVVMRGGLGNVGLPALAGSCISGRPWVSR